MKRVNSNNARFFRGKSQLPFIIIFLIIAAVAIILVLSFIKKESSFRVNEPVYQFYSFERVDYDDGVELSVGRRGTLIDDRNAKSESDASPLYYSDRAAFIIPTDMCWLEPTTGIERSIPALSQVYLDEAGNIWCSSGKKASQLSGGFLYGVSDTFLFLDGMNMTVDGKSYKLSPLSFYSSAYDGVRIYDYKTDEITTLDKISVGASALAVTGYIVDLVSCIYTDSDGVNKLLAARPSVLPGIWG